MFWIAAAILTGITCLALLAVLRRNDSVDSGHDKAFYEAQLAEIERQLAIGLIAPQEATAAKTEAARRLLASPSSELEPRDQGAPLQMASRKIASVVTLVAVPLIALPVYLGMGSPSMPSFPLAGQASRATAPTEASATASQAGLDVEKVVQQIEAHLQKNPDDGKGHEVVGPVYMRMERYDDAVRSFEASLRLLGPTADRQFNLGEALVFQAKGDVTPQASTAFEAAVALDRNHLKAQFFLALGAQQNGDLPRAQALLSSIRDRIPDGELKSEIDRQLAALASVPKGGETIAALPLSQQEAAIRSMVEGLAERLATTGGPVEDWARLIRALTVLRETDRARAIMAEAKSKFADRPEQLQMIEQAGQVP